MDGWGKLGAALGGGGSNAYNRGMESAARTDMILRKAAEERDKALAREGRMEALRKAGVPEEKASLLNTLFNAGDNPEQVSGYQLDTQKLDLTNEAATAARGGNIDAANDLLTVLSGKPRERTAITGGMAYDAFKDPSQAMAVTPVGAADIAATGALARERSAGAQENLAHAALYGVQTAAGGWKPDSPNSKPEAFTGPTQGSLTAVFSSGEEGELDTNAVRDFQVWRNANPQYRNGEEALGAYVAASKPTGGVRIIDPRRPGSMTQSPAPLSQVFASGDSAIDAVAAQIESETGVKLTPAQRQAIKAGTFEMKASDPASKPSSAAPAAVIDPAVQRALSDAREAVRRGLLTKEQARARLIQAGMANIAERL